ncbi:MFS transporter [Nocardia sp. SYP-A9097]|uniref:MFS transporter n=1 Tax=Nocardia sp. SYP-A9097 TaxID=2663237 RepID=UPI00129A39FD|nr:MFS transporter [Nocardia sp. SYP-A9097]MRH89355.1 MFS transporter [Nocardia sp. SYP-A9097]
MTLEAGNARRANTTAGTGSETDPDRAERRQRTIVLVVLCGTGFLFSHDVSLHSIAVPTLLQQLGDRPNLHIAQWTPKVYVLTFAALLMLGGALADRLGAKRVLVGGYLMYLAGAAVHVAVPTTVLPLALARVVMGAAVALIIPANLLVLSAVSGSSLHRAKAFTIWAGCCAAGVTVVPLVTGLILNDVLWPKVMVAIGISAVALLIGIIRFVPVMPADPGSPVDWPTITIATLGSGLTVFAFLQAPEWGWAAPWVAGPLVGGLVLAITSAVIRRGGHLPLDYLFRADARLRPAIFAVAVAVLTLCGMVFLTVQYLQAVRGHAPIVAGTIIFLPSCAATVIGAKLGQLVRRPYGVTAAFTCGLTAILDGLAFGLTADAAGDLGAIVAMVTAASVGFGMVMSVGLDMVSAALSASGDGIAWAAMETTVQVAGYLGLAIVGSLVDRGYHAGLVVPGHIPAPDGVAMSHDSLGKGVAAAAASGGDGIGAPLADAVQNAFLTGYRHGLLATIAVVAAVMIGILVSAARSKSSAERF